MSAQPVVEWAYSHKLYAGIIVVILLLIIVCVLTYAISGKCPYKLLKSKISKQKSTFYNKDDYERELTYYKSLSSKQQEEYLLLSPDQKKSKF